MAVFCSPFFNSYSRHGGKYTYFVSERSSVATIAPVLGHSVAVPQKGRIAQTGEYGTTALLCFHFHWVFRRSINTKKVLLRDNITWTRRGRQLILSWPFFTSWSSSHPSFHCGCDPFYTLLCRRVWAHINTAGRVAISSMAGGSGSWLCIRVSPGWLYNSHSVIIGLNLLCNAVVI